MPKLNTKCSQTVNLSKTVTGTNACATACKGRADCHFFETTPTGHCILRNYCSFSTTGATGHTVYKKETGFLSCSGLAKNPATIPAQKNLAFDLATGKTVPNQL